MTRRMMIIYALRRTRTGSGLSVLAAAVKQPRGRARFHSEPKASSALLRAGSCAVGSCPVPAVMFGVDQDEEGTPVQLAVYDISNGWAKILSPLLFCRKIPIAPHTGIIIFGQEYFWAGGIQKLRHEEFEARQRIRAVEIIDLGRTQMPEDLFHDFILGVGSRYTSDTYDILGNNCNNFTEECAQVREEAAERARSTAAPRLLALRLARANACSCRLPLCARSSC